ncbi:MAG: molybdopterin-binding protein [Flexistipes sinusarabici]|uniref:Molybdopterin molybdenumtransferase n=1 Tax=Flexistipes sinusarabici TaxID=2352 RepID=A0A5D0MK70_FLESI|nr:molybdopterin-binding protein [Flexistipes sinusarabici]TYB32802.1 MAG: molybdopterin-binding protein [Flexistipes sinusarabici]
MKKLKVEDAVGKKLAYDITEVNLDTNFKGVAFNRGHFIEEKDLEHLLRLGKEFVFVEYDETGEVHENDVATAIAPLAAGENIYYSEAPMEGKIDFFAAADGIFTVDTETVLKINRMEIPSMPTISDKYPVTAGTKVAAFRIIPLTCKKAIFDEMKTIMKQPVLSVKKYTISRVSIIVTGNEIYYGKIEDKFTEKLKQKLRKFGISNINSKILPDDEIAIASAVKEESKQSGLILITGGTSVDPDDKTRPGIENAGVEFVQKGNPIQPGNNFSIGYLGGTTVCAVPAAALFYNITSLDIFLPQILAEIEITKDDIASKAIGGLCHQCKICVYPVCSFGKGVCLR